MSHRILAINPGSVSTKACIFEDEQLVAEVEVQHDKAELSGFAHVLEQFTCRRVAVEQALGLDLEKPLDAVVGRGGLLRPLPGGVYAIGPAMIEDLRLARYGEHASNLGALLAVHFAARDKAPAFIVDAVVTDEMRRVARLTGLPEVQRRSVFHALSQRGAARQAAMRLGIRYRDARFLVAHMGGGISMGAHDMGRVVDVINALDGEGPFSPERAGCVPLVSALRLLEQGVYTAEQLRCKVLSQSGLFAHLGTNDLREVERRMDVGDEAAVLVFEALAYNIVKQLCSLAPALLYAPENCIAAVVLTGGLSRSGRLVEAGSSTH